MWLKRIVIDEYGDGWLRKSTQRTADDEERNAYT
jgi:hypothetical protein